MTDFYREGTSVMNVTQFIGSAEEGVFPEPDGYSGSASRTHARDD